MKLTNKIFKFYPWFESRKNLIYQLSIETLIFILISFLLGFNRVNIIFFGTLHSFYTLSSYVLGRYYIKANKITALIFPLLVRFVFLYLISFLFSFLLNFAIFQDGFELELANKYLSTFTIITIFHQFLFQFYFSDQNSRKSNWIYFGSIQVFNKLLKELDLPTLDKNINKNFKVSFLDRLENLDQNKINNIIIDADEIDREKLDLNFGKNNKLYFFTLMDWSKSFLQRYPVDLFNDKNMYLNNLFFYPRELEQRIKRTSEFIISILLLFITIPILILSVLAIYLEDKGPPFYSQERTGLNGRIFKIIKLRTMIINAENDGPKWSTKNDSRITKIGAILRKLRIDELPQLISVLNGDMSLIGPRPERPSINSDLKNEIPLYDLRHRIKPGLTGWAQVNYPYGSSIYDAKAKLGFDLYYIHHFSNTLDLLIFFKTIRLILNARGAISNK